MVTMFVLNKPLFSVEREKKLIIIVSARFVYQTGGMIVAAPEINARVLAYS